MNKEPWCQTPCAGCGRSIGVVVGAVAFNPPTFWCVDCAGTAVKVYTAKDYETGVVRADAERLLSEWARK